MDDTHITCKHLVFKLTSLNTQHFLLEGEITNTRKAVMLWSTEIVFVYTAAKPMSSLLNILHIYKFTTETGKSILLIPSFFNVALLYNIYKW